jgi:hypothetical protein
VHSLRRVNRPGESARPTSKFAANQRRLVLRTMCETSRRCFTFERGFSISSTRTTVPGKLADEADFLQRLEGFFVLKLEKHRFLVAVLDRYADGRGTEREGFLKQCQVLGYRAFIG